MKNRNMDMQEIGCRIRRERENIKLTREQFAEAIDISPMYVGQIERGQRTMSLNTFVRICRSLHVSADYLIFGESAQEQIRETAGAYGSSVEIGQEKQKIVNLLDKCSDRELRLAAEILKLLTTHVP